MRDFRDLKVWQRAHELVLDADFARFVQMAIGSASEVEYQLLLAHDLKFIDQAPYRDLSERVVEVRRMLISLLQTLKAQSS